MHHDVHVRGFTIRKGSNAQPARINTTTTVA